MENNLDRVMEEICADPGVLGCLFADQQGLCIGSKGQASNDTAGYVTAIASQVAKLEPDNKTPVVTLENEHQMCMIQRSGAITGAIYKKL